MHILNDIAKGKQKSAIEINTIFVHDHILRQICICICDGHWQLAFSRPVEFCGR